MKKYGFLVLVLPLLALTLQGCGEMGVTFSALGMALRAMLRVNLAALSQNRGIACELRFRGRRRLFRS